MSPVSRRSLSIFRSKYGDMTLLCEMLVSVRFVLLKKKMEPTISVSTGLSDALDVLKDRGPDCTETKMREPSESLSPHRRSP